MNVWTFNTKSKPTNKGSGKDCSTAVIVLFLKKVIPITSGKAPNITAFLSSTDMFKVRFLDRSKERYIYFIFTMKVKNKELLRLKQKTTTTKKKNLPQFSKSTNEELQRSSKQKLHSK